MGSTNRPTLESIAKALGISRMTVSLALRDDKRIASNTRAKVREEASLQGYQPNPLIGAYMAGVRRRKTAGESPRIAYVAGACFAEHQGSPHLSQLLQGVRSRSKGLGFKLLEFFGCGHTTGLQAIETDLGRQQVVGIVLAPFPPTAGPIRLPWQRFCNVAVGYSAKRPPMHTVTDEKLRIGRLVIEQVANSTSMKIGFVTFEDHEKLHSHGLTSAFLAWQMETGPANRIPILRMKGIAETKKMQAWMKKHQPAVILSPLDLSKEPIKAIIKTSLFVQLCQSRGLKKSSGMLGSIEPNREVGIAAVDMIAGLIYRHETGLPLHPCVVEVPGVLCRPNSSIVKSH